MQGFKSFANKNSLIFPGMISGKKRGITSIVGPNGSGKSNVADAVRWALGEQSLKVLRGKRFEDVIFSGSDQKGKLSMAEVSLVLNNEDSVRPQLAATEGVEENFLDSLFSHSQIIITRRVYRSGESEYLINNQKARLSDIQIFLAKANFGQKTYSVIGQGMVEGFLNISLSERKDFFDEATGVKQYQIKRDLSLNKLESSYENLSQAQMLVDEIEPRLRILTRQVGRLKKREELEKELSALRLKHFSFLWKDIDTKLNEVNGKISDLEKHSSEKELFLEALREKFASLENTESDNSRFLDLESAMSYWQSKKDEITRQLAKVEAYLENRLESRGKFDISFLNNRQRQLEGDKEQLSLDIEKLRSEMEGLKTSRKDFDIRKQKLDKALAELDAWLNESDKKPVEDDVNQKLSQALEKIQAALVTEDLALAKNLMFEVRQYLEEVLALSDDSRQEEVLRLREEMRRLDSHRADLSQELSAFNLKQGTLSERERSLLEQQDRLSVELKDIALKLSQQEDDVDDTPLIEERDDLKNKLTEANTKLQEVKKELSDYNSNQEAGRSQLLSVQRQMQEEQLQLNEISSRLNNIKIEATREETHLEDLENDIRQVECDLSIIRKGIAFDEEFDVVQAADRINHLQKSLEMIGGIDHEVVGEYAGTKERYEFLTGQIDDLNSTIKSLEKIIGELDTMIKEKFDREFAIISTKFSEYFKILFNGGQAKIVKVMANTSEDDSEKGELENNTLNKIKFLKKYNSTGLAGIDIEATPPGKKIRNVAMLSGGERALTAIGLICAIISANPSPFVVLDEADAALDEANSERLAKILDDLSNYSQFIVITHNRASMRKASVLYGVTMQADGVSQLLSVKLEDGLNQ